MRLGMKALVLSIALAAAVVAHAQEVIETADGSYRAFQDQHGRYVRLESSDGVVIHYLYDSPSASAESGVTINVPNGPTLTVHYDGQDMVWTRGMPTLTIVSNDDGRTTEVRADGRAIALFEYRADQYVGAVVVPGRFTLRATPPDARHRVRQTLLDATGRVLQQTEVVSSAASTGMWKGMAFDRMASLSFRPSPAGYLSTGRDADGHVALYIVSAGRVSVGFAPDGAPRFYDVTADIFDSDIPPGSDAGTSIALEQSKAVPSHVTLTAEEIPGIYVEEPADGAIYAVWAERNGEIGSRRASSGRRDSERPVQ